MIPENLKKEDFKFVLIKKKEKRPFEEEWQKNNNYSYNDPKLITHLKNEGNYGVLCGNGLIVIDADTKKLNDIVKEKLPETFTVKTSKGHHYYYYCIGFDKKKVLDDKGEHLGEIQSNKTQVVAPGSTHPTGIKYEVSNNKEIIEIEIEEINKTFEKYYSSERINKETILEGIEQGLRNESMFKLACSFKAKRMTITETFTTLQTINQKNKPPLQEQEIKQIIESAYKYPDNKELINKEYSEMNIISLLALKKRNKATEKIVEEIKEKNNIYTTRNDEKSQMWIYKEGIYIPEGKTYIKEFCREKLGELFTNQIVNEVISKIEADTYINQEKFFIVQDVNKIAVKNGILNLKTRELEPFNPKYFFFNKINAKYKPEGKCPKIKEFFKSIMQDEHDVKVLQELFGYSLYRDYKYEKAFMLLGGGRNGKGKTNELLKRFIGITNCANISLQRIEKDGFSLSGLHNKMLNLSSDISNTGLEQTGNFKMLTGHDMISAPRKFLTDIEFTNYAKMIFSANELPITKDITLAFFNRWILIEFPYTFLDQKDIDSLKEEDKIDVKLADKEIIEKISTEEELDGLLNWSLEGFDRLEKNSCFSYSSSTEQTKNKWLRKSSSINAFIMDKIEQDYDSTITKQDFKNFYINYCREHKIKPESDKIIKEVLSTTLGVIDKRSSEGDRSTVWVGIRFRPPEVVDVKGVKDVNGFSSPIGNLISYKSSKTHDKVDTLDRFRKIDPIWHPCHNCGTTELACNYVDIEHSNHFYCKICIELVVNDKNNL